MRVLFLLLAPLGALASSPTAAPTPCADDGAWHVESLESLDCDWVASSISSRCVDGAKSSDGRTAVEGCPATCDATCGANATSYPTAAPTSGCAAAKRVHSFCRGWNVSTTASGTDEISTTPK